MAALISIWLIHCGRKPLGSDGQPRQMYMLEQLLPSGWELVAWAGVLGSIYIFTGLGLSTQCLPLFTGGPLAILLCYVVLFLLLVLHLHRAPDQCDKAHDAPIVTNPSRSSSIGETKSSINAPILQLSTATNTIDDRQSGATAGPAESDAARKHASTSFPEIEWRWTRGVCVAAAASTSITVLCKLLPVLGAVGSTLVILGVDWSGVVVGWLYFVVKAIAGGVWLLMEAPLSPMQANHRGDDDAGTRNAVGIVAALFSAILVPALLANIAVEVLPQLRAPAIAAGVLVGSVLLSIVLALVGLCCICRGRVQ